MLFQNQHHSVISCQGKVSVFGSTLLCRLCETKLLQLAADFQPNNQTELKQKLLVLEERIRGDREIEKQKDCCLLKKRSLCIHLRSGLRGGLSLQQRCKETLQKMSHFSSSKLKMWL
ncbi:hypothetical protein ILYODFUR_020147 [Ilyodon furcidens]|uniref:Uncharacterized protein n=1 Tax=Ilyodon furcidens TaxID=33524 RepID=A0ABV0UTL5_9TELE